MKINSKILITAHVLISSILINAQTSKTKLPGDFTLVSSQATLEKLISHDKGDFKYNVEDYFAIPVSERNQIKLRCINIY